MERSIAVELPSSSKTSIEFLEMLIKTTNKYQDTRILGNLDASKKYFRIKYLNELDAEEADVADTGYYIWTANSFKDTNVEIMNMEKYLEFLIEISKESNIFSGFEVEFDAHYIHIGCQTYPRVAVERFIMAIREMRIENIRLVTADDNIFSLEKSGLERFEKKLFANKKFVLKPLKKGKK